VNARFPPKGTSVTSFSSSGSKRTAVPAAMSSRCPNASSLAKSRARWTSKKWKWDATWTGRSPVFRTVSLTLGRPALVSMGAAART
jgi:hypothetical protein